MDVSERNKRTKSEILLSLLYKAVDGVAYFLLVTLTLSFLGQESYSSWLAISSAIVWVYQLDFGIGDSLRNNLTKAIANNDHELASVSISSSVAGLIFLSSVYVTFGGAFLIVYSHSHGGLSDGERLLSWMCLFSIVILNLKIVEKIYNAILLPSIVGLIASSIRFLSCLSIALFLLFKMKESLPLVSFSFMIVTIAVYCFSIIYLNRMNKFDFRYLRISSIRWSYLKGELGRSVYFFILQIFSPLIALVANICLYKILLSSDVLTFNISNRYLSIILVAFSTIIGTLWNYATDAKVMHDTKWIETWVQRMRHMCLGVFVLLMLMVLISPVFYKLWLGNKVYIGLFPTFLMALFVFLNIWNHGHTIFLQAFGEHRKIAMTSMLSMLLFLPLLPYSCKWFGLDGLLIILILMYFMVCVCSYLLVENLILKAIKYEL